MAPFRWIVRWKIVFSCARQPEQNWLLGACFFVGWCYHMRRGACTQGEGGRVDKMLTPQRVTTPQVALRPLATDFPAIFASVVLFYHVRHVTHFCTWTYELRMFFIFGLTFFACAKATQCSTAQHSTAQHSTAQHSTAQHSTAQHSTAPQCDYRKMAPFDMMTTAITWCWR